MHVTIRQDVVFGLIDVLLARWKAKQYPYNRPDAIIPQKIIPKEMRADTYTLSCFYFYVCIYMRGGIESLQAFSALIRMWREHPKLFDPWEVQYYRPPEVQAILKEFIGWDSRSASISWVENSQRLMRHYQGNPLNLIKGVRDYDEALRRIRNKTTKRDLASAGHGGGGFRGFQPKMVSMFLYFCDWEGWLKPRFLYPSPADFHNFRIGLANGGIVVELGDGESLSASEKLSAPWRAVVMEYLRARKADPIEVSDALWLFSLVMCGNSPLTVTKQPGGQHDLLSRAGLAGSWQEDQHEKWVASHKRTSLAQTCFVCPFVHSCTLAIPAQPYYRRGKLLLHKRLRVERHINLALVKEPKPSAVEVDASLYFLSALETPA